MSKYDNLSREAKITLIADSMPYPLPEGMAAAAIASGQSVEAFAIAAADHCTATRQAASAKPDEQAQIAAVASRIVNGGPYDLRALASEGELARQAAARVAESADAIARRIMEA